MSIISQKEQKAILQAQQYISQNNAASAKEILLQYSRNNKLGQNGLHLLCLSYAILGELSKSRDLSLKLLKNAPGNVEYLKLLAGSYHGLAQYNDAIKYFKRALKINHNDYMAMSNLASSYKESGRFEEAEKLYIESLAIQRNQPDALTNYGLLMQVNGSVDEAIRLHQQALLLSPAHINALYNLAYALNEKGDNDRSLQIYMKVIELHPDNTNALRDIGNVYCKINKPKLAIPYLLKANAIIPDDVNINLNLGIAYQMSEQTDRAKEHFNQVLAYSPDNKTAAYYLAILAGDNSIGSSPDEYVQQLFDGYAETFDDQLINKLQYKTPQLISDLILNHVNKENKYKILDIGCGTGLAGIYLKPLASSLIGVDLSEKMLKKAAQRDLYDELIASSIEEYFETLDHQSDIVVSADVFVYIGDLTSIFSAVSKALQVGGLFVFSTEDSKNCTNYELRKSGRFAHNEHYINQLSEFHGFGIIRNDEMVIRQESNTPIIGQVYLLKKNK